MELKGLPKNWLLKNFCEIADYHSGRTPSRSNDEYWRSCGNGVAWVSISDMKNYELVLETKEKITQLAFTEIFREKISAKGTLIMSFKLTIGRVAKLGIDACHNEAIISIYPRNNILKDYLFYYLSQVNYVDLQDRQVKGNTLNQEKINRIPILLPPMDEQNKFVSVLNLTRKLINFEKLQLDQTQALKTAAMQELFTKGLRGEKQKQAEIGLVPESWEVVKLRTLIYKPDYGVTASATDDRGGKKFLRITDIQEGIVNWNTVPYCDCGRDDYLSKELGEDDLLIARIGATTGKSYIVNKVSGAVVFASYLIRVRVSSKSLLAKFLYYYTCTHYYWLHINQHKGGRLKGGVNIPIISDINIPLPGILEQAQIVEILDTIDQKIQHHKHKKTLLEELFNVLLHQLMTGKLRVDDLDLSALEEIGGFNDD